MVAQASSIHSEWSAIRPARVAFLPDPDMASINGLLSPEQPLLGARDTAVLRLHLAGMTPREHTAMPKAVVVRAGYTQGWSRRSSGTDSTSKALRARRPYRLRTILYTLCRCGVYRLSIPSPACFLIVAHAFAARLRPVPRFRRPRINARLSENRLGCLE